MRHARHRLRVFRHGPAPILPWAPGAGSGNAKQDALSVQQGIKGLEQLRPMVRFDARTLTGRTEAVESRRHEKKVAEIENGYWPQVIVSLLICAGPGFVFSRKDHRVDLATATRPAPQPEPVTPLATCKRNACSGEIQFNEDGFDSHNPPTVTCPHCGMDTLLYIPGGVPHGERRGC